MRKYRYLFLSLFVLLASCGLQVYFAHRARVEQQKMLDTMRRLDEASHRLNEIRHQVEQETEQLQKLLKMLAATKPGPDCKSKL
jgi:hypothetical protein